MSFVNIFQQHIYSQLATEFGAALVVAHPPADMALPLIQIGNFDYEDHPAEAKLTVYIHSWSETEGPHQAQDYMSRIRGLFHATHHTASPWKFSCIRESFSDVLLDEDNETWHGVQRFETIISAV